MRLTAFLTGLALLLTSLCFGQARRLGDTRATQLYGEIIVLQRLVPLELTDPQLAALLELYARHDVQDEGEKSEAVRKLEEMKQRLLAGTPLVALDLQTLRDVTRELQRGRRAGGGRPGEAPATEAPVAATDETLTPLEQAAWEVLTQAQRAALLGDVRGAAANNQKFDQAQATRAMGMIGRLLRLEDVEWQKARTRLAEALAMGAAAAGTPARDNSRKMFVEFLDRLREMPGADFAARQTELGAELLALLPPGTSLAVALAEYDVRQIRYAMGASLTHPSAPDLIKQMQTARTQAQGQ